MSTFTVELFIHKMRYMEEYTISDSDLSSNGIPLLGTQVVTLNVPAKDINQAEIEALGKKVVSVKATAQSEVTCLEERIQELKCLEFKDGE